MNHKSSQRESKETKKIAITILKNPAVCLGPEPFHIWYFKGKIDSCPPRHSRHLGQGSCLTFLGFERKMRQMRHETGVSFWCLILLKIKKRHKMGIASLSSA